jgi:hypothetical protein
MESIKEAPTPRPIRRLVVTLALAAVTLLMANLLVLLAVLSAPMPTSGA